MCRSYCVLMLVLGVLFLTPAAADDYEVWLVDQSNTLGVSHGGALYIYDGHALTRDAAAAEPVDRIDFSAETSILCLAATGANPVRPHMLTFNSTETHAVLSFVVSGHVVIYDARSRTPVACFRTEVGAGGQRQAHAAWPTGDDRFILVANQNGKKLERIRTNYGRNEYSQEPAATLDLANCTTPNGLPCQAAGLRPDTAPICPFTASNNGPAFVSLRGGGLFVVNWRTTPMSIVSEYDLDNVPANGCGFIEAKGWIYANGGGGTAANLDQFTVYRVSMHGHRAGGPPNQPTVQVLFNDDAHERDAHGVAVTRNERFVWIGDRDANLAEVFDSWSGSHAGTVNLVSSLSADPTPDLFAISPDKRWLFVSTRGPNPLTGDPHSSTGQDPGVLVIRLREGGATGEVRGLARITNIDALGIERADAHGIRIRCADPVPAGDGAT